MELTVLDTPLGSVRIAVDDDAVTGLKFAAGGKGRRADRLGAVHALAAYFSGIMDALVELPVRPAGTEFQQRVWRALRTVPAGETVSYTQLAQEIGQPAGGAGRGARQRDESDWHHYSVPSRHPVRRLARRLRRRPRPKAVAAETRGRRR